MRQFLSGLLVGAVVTGGLGYRLLMREQNRQLIFPPAQYMDLGDGQPPLGYVEIAGSVTGTQSDRVGNPNNYIKMSCRREQSACDVLDVSQIGPHQMGDVTLEQWTVSSWTPDMIVVQSNAPQNACYRVTVNIMRRTHEVQYVRQPQMQNAARPECHEMGMTLSRWTISETPYWRDADTRHQLPIPPNVQR